MKRFILWALALGVLSVGLVQAQDYNQTTQTSTTTTTDMTVSGTVVSSDNDNLTIRTDTGTMTFKLDTALDRARYGNLAAGTRVAVTHRMETAGTNAGMDVATNINVTSEPSASTTTSTTTTTTTDNTYAQNTRSTLPATASSLPLVGLLGVLALAGALALRERRKSA